MIRLIQTMLLLSLFINIAHASIIAAAESCDHGTVCEYVVEIEQGGDCGDLCDMHHMFHLNAIPPVHGVVIAKLPRVATVEYREPAASTPHPDPFCRPPISI